MFVLRPKTAFTVIGLLISLGIFDSALRFSVLAPEVAICNRGIGLGIALPGAILWFAIAGMLLTALWQVWTLSLGAEYLGAESIAWAAIFVGGLTNAVDRLAHGCVQDYFHPPFFPSFNLADIMVFLGVVILALFLLGILPKAKPYVS